jgi:ribonuclease P protein component
MKLKRTENPMVYTQILNDNKDFLTLYRKGKYIVSKVAVVYYRKNDLPFNRLGITAGKKVGNAVHRNRAKRIIRQAYRENELKLPVGYDFVIVARAITGNGEVKSTDISEFLGTQLVKELSQCL